jgi:hypothetical protein
MWPNLGVPATVFWQWANQTQNALLNHYNRCAALLLSRAVLSGARFVSHASASRLAHCDDRRPSVEPQPRDRTLQSYGMGEEAATPVGTALDAGRRIQLSPLPCPLLLAPTSS